MSNIEFRRMRVVPSVVILFGIVAIAAAFAVDYTSVGKAPGFGSKQILLTIGGVLAILTGAALLSHRGQALLAEPPETVQVGPLGYGSLLILSVWFGLLAGLPEAVLVLVEQLSAQKAIILADYGVWMPPIPYILLFWIVGSALTLLALAGWRAATEVSTVLVAFCFLASLGPLFMLEDELHIFAIMILAAGISVQLARILLRRPRALLRLATLTSIPLALLFVAGAVALGASRSQAERRELAELSSLGPDAPNVLLIILDTVRSPSLSLYGYDRPTSPQLSRLAETGAVFDRAFSTAPWTLPSHGSLFTGYYANDLTADWATPLDGSHPTLAEFLRDRGYLTAGFVANRVYTGPGSGLDRGFTHYDADIVSFSEILRSSSPVRYVAEQRWFQNLVGYYDDLGRKRAEVVTGEFLKWLDGTESAPFFVFLNYYDAHDPYLPRKPFEEAFRTTDETCTQGAISPRVLRDAAKLRSCVDGYDGSIAELDHYLDVLLEDLDGRGVLDNTLLIVTSDHGEQFGDHGLASHGRSLYLPSLWVPLLIRFPERVPAGVRVHESVTLRDIPATVVDLVGDGVEHPFPGRSLARYWDPARSPDAGAGIVVERAILSETSARRWLPAHNPVARGDMRSVVAAGMHYILNGDGVVELYDIEADPWEEDDLSGLSTSQPTLEQFAEVLTTLEEEGSVPQERHHP